MPALHVLHSRDDETTPSDCATLSGDVSTSCATCHDPNNAFADGKPLSDGYSRGNLYFRNTPTLPNTSKMPVYDLDG